MSARCRRFTLADAMIFIAATAVGCAGVRAILQYSDYRLVGSCAHTMLAAWTPAWLCARIRNPRPARRRLLRQPGTMAAVAALLSMISTFALMWCGAWMGEFLFVSYALPGIYVYLGYYLRDVGLTVASVWMIQWLAKTGRCEPGWIDRTGRILGVGWITLWILGELNII